MGGSSFLNAFRLIFKKPVLLLLLLPLQLAMAAFTRFWPAPAVDTGNLVNPTQALNSTLNSMMGTYVHFVYLILIFMLLYLVAGFILIPPAMELLHGGAKGEESQPGWFGRGMRKHWWKPVSIGAIEVGIMTFLYILMFLTLILMASMIGTASTSPDEGSILAPMIPFLIFLFIWLAVFIFALMLILSFFAMLMPATADRGFGKSFGILFSKRGFKKVMKVCGVYFLISLITILIEVVFTAGYILLSGRDISTSESFSASVSAFGASWAGTAYSVLVSLMILFKYGYIFSVFQEIKNKEAAALPPSPKDAWSVQQ